MVHTIVAQKLKTSCCFLNDCFKTDQSQRGSRVKLDRKLVICNYFLYSYSTLIWDIDLLKLPEWYGIGYLLQGLTANAGKAALKLQLFPYNHTVDDVSTGINSSRQRKCPSESCQYQCQIKIDRDYHF